MGYADYAPVYRAAGWLGVLPLPGGKKEPPPLNFTGWHAPDPSEDQVAIWIESAPNGNIAIRLPEGVVGIDVDDYGDKHGLKTLALAEERWGKLPATWMSTAREGGSGIRFFRVPDGTRFPGKLEIDGLSDIEVIQRGHRYAVVYPSVHPNGAQYTWYYPSGRKADEEPCVDQLPELPESWIQGIQSSGKLFGISGEKRRLTQDDALQELLSFHNALSETCPVMRERVAEAIENLGNPGARHDSALADSMALIGYGHLGHPGVVTALEELQREFLARVSADREGADREFDRMVYGGLAKLDATPPASADPCQQAESPLTEEEEKFNKDVKDKVYKMKVTEAARIQFNNDLAGELVLPELESAESLALAVPETPDWLVEGLIPRTGVITLSAQKKVGKTTIVHKLLEAVLNGGTFLDSFQCHKPAGSVCIFDLELPRDKLGQWIRRNGIARHDVYATSLRGKVSNFNIMNEVHRKNIAEDLKAKNCALLVVDPLGPYLRMTGADENSATEAGRALDALISLKEEANVDTLLLPLHAGHSDKGRARGSSVLADVPDVIISLYKKNENEEIRQLSAVGRDIDVDALSFTYDLDTGEITMLEGGTPDDARDDDVISVLAVLERVSGISQNQVVKAMKAEAIGCGPSRAKKALALAIKSGYVRAEATAPDVPKAPINHYLTEKGTEKLSTERRVIGEAA